MLYHAVLFNIKDVEPPFVTVLRVCALTLVIFSTIFVVCLFENEDESKQRAQ